MSSCRTCDGSGFITTTDENGKPIKVPCPNHTGK